VTWANYFNPTGHPRRAGSAAGAPHSPPAGRTGSGTCWCISGSPIPGWTSGGSRSPASSSCIPAPS